MFLKYLILFATTILCASSNVSDMEDLYLNFSTQIESLKKLMDLIKIQLDVLSEENPYSYSCPIDTEFSSQVFENFDDVKKSLYDLNNQPDKHKSKCDDMEMKRENLSTQQERNITANTLNDKYSILLEELYTLKKSEKSLKQENAELNAKYLESLKDNEVTKKNLLTGIKHVRQSEESLKQKNTELEVKIDELLRNDENTTKSFDIKENQSYSHVKRPLFDARTDKLPEEYKNNCIEDPNPVDCQTATKCTRMSGYYKINIPGNKTEQIMVYCDMETHGGGWLHIVRRLDGLEKFNRRWKDYVNGFGTVEGEYWIGLNNLHALTNNNGRQQLYVYIENFKGQSRYALYDNFSVGNITDSYKLRSLGSYSGTAGDDMSYNVGEKFSTNNKDNDSFSYGNCAESVENLGGWWYKSCTFVLPTGPYLYGESEQQGVLWKQFGGWNYSHKFMFLMIRKFDS